MPSLRRSIPSMSALASFEAAARLGSFTQAAAELGVTQAAVSRQIRLLEADLNTALFVRANRRVLLTAPGAALAARVTTAFAGMAEMIETIRQPVLADTVTLGTTLAFSHFWILPRLPQFRAAHPGIKLRLVSDDAQGDLRRERHDVAVRFGEPPFADGRSLASHPETVFPVCSPALLAQHGLTGGTGDLLRLPLIASETLNPAWLSWRSWGQAAGLAPATVTALAKASDQGRLRFNHYTDAIQAALNGEGVALGWETLVAELIATGRLIRIGGHRLATTARYHILTPAGRDPSPAALCLVQWLTAAFDANAQRLFLDPAAGAPGEQGGA